MNEYYFTIEQRKDCHQHGWFDLSQLKLNEHHPECLKFYKGKYYASRREALEAMAKRLKELLDND